jgi:hypothetical protein
MMDSARMELQARVDRYLAGHMSADETAAFEIYMLDHPEILDDVDVARRLKHGLASLRTKGELEGLVRGGSLAVRQRYLAIAASVLAVLGLASWYLAGRVTDPGILVAASLGELGAGDDPNAILGEVLLVRTRSGGQAEVSLAPKGLYQLRFMVDAAPGALEAVLNRQDAKGDALQRIDGLRPDPDGLVSVYFDAAAAGRGRYLLEIERRSSTGSIEEVADFRIEVK